MAISVNPETRVITVLQADLTLISGALYELDVDWFFLQLKDWEDDEVGMSMPDAQRHGPPVTLSGVTYAQTVELINGYTVTFEDTGSPYTVRCTGANHNLADVTNYVSEVSLIIGNSSGLVVVADAVDTQRLADVHAAHYNRRTRNPTTGVEVIYESDGTTPLATFDSTDDGTQITEITPA